jgi:glycosyltransferase involved in cell wall biosynthesis
MIRLAILASHPVQYYTPLFRELARHVDLTVLYAHRATANDQAKAGFGVGFEWDVELFSGYRYEFLPNLAKQPGLDRFSGVDTPTIGKRLKEGRFHVLMLMGWHLKCFLQALFAAKRMGLPVMVRGDSHLETPRSPFKRAAKRLLYPPFLRQFDAALYVGERNRRYWEHYAYPAERLFYSSHCVDNGWFAARATPEARQHVRQDMGIPQNSKVVLFAGKLVPFKRPIDVVEAIAKIEQSVSPVRLLIAGAGQLDHSIQAKADELGAYVHALGFCNQSDMPRAYAAADALVLPSSGQETWGLVVNEALACGRPVIVSDAVGSAPDLQRLLGLHSVYPVGDVGALAECLDEVLTSPPSLEEIARAADHFSVANAAVGIVAAARSIVTR